MAERKGASAVARIRRWWWRHVRRYAYEICGRCGRPVGATCPSYWTTSDAMWNTIEGGPAGIRCIPCFGDDAAAAGVPIYWCAHHEHLPEGVAP